MDSLVREGREDVSSLNPKGGNLWGLMIYLRLEISPLVLDYGYFPRHEGKKFRFGGAWVDRECTLSTGGGVGGRVLLGIRRGMASLI